MSDTDDENKVIKIPYYNPQQNNLGWFIAPIVKSEVRKACHIIPYLCVPASNHASPEKKDLDSVFFIFEFLAGLMSANKGKYVGRMNIFVQSAKLKNYN